jgi:hypothetical protein
MKGLFERFTGLTSSSRHRQSAVQRTDIIIDEVIASPAAGLW